MKRRINNIHLSCVTSLLPGFTKLIIEDRKASEIMMDGSENTRTWVGFAKDLYNAGYRKVERGEWERVGENRFRCTVCKSVLYLFAKFCPECGADMRSNKDDRKRKD